MKNLIIVIALLASTLAGVRAQVTANGATTTANQPALPAPTASSPVSRDGSSTVWERTVYERSPNGIIVPRKSRYTELSSGLNFYDSNAKQWTPSREQIDLLPPGGAFAAAATHGQHSARFPLDIAKGVIQLSTPDGKQLQSRPVGLFYEDDNNSALIAILTNSAGELVGSNSVVYPEAFEGAAASIRYTYTKSGFEQDIVVQGQLPDPAALGLIPAKTRLGLLTAFFDTNNPVVTPGPTDPQTGLSDATLRFGAMTMTKGRAFSIGDGEQTPPPAGATAASWLNWITNAASSGGTPTYKRWFQLNGRNFLMEEVPYQRVAAQFEQLPPTTGRLDAESTNLWTAESFLDAIPARLLSLPPSGEPVNTQTMRLSRVGLDETRAVVLDYTVTLNSGHNNWVFQGDTTYFVSASCNLTGATTIEGGAVIKANSMGTINIDQNGTIACNTGQYRPAVFTSFNDNTVGETINGSSGSPALYDANEFLNIGATYASVHDLHFAYCNLAMFQGNGGLLNITNCQFQNIANAVVGYNIELFNVLIAPSPYVFYPSVSFTGPSLVAANVTAGYATGGSHWNCFVYPVNSSATVTLVNCLVTGYPIFAYGSATLVSTATYNLSSGAGVYQTVGGGNFYLAYDSPYHNAGTANLAPYKLADLADRTTHPPVAYNTTISSYDFTVQVPRDTGSPGPDVGYHYDPLDYIFRNCSVDSDMTFPAGTAVGWQKGPQGQPGLSFTQSYCRIGFDHGYFVRCNAVQEADNSGDGTGIAGNGQYVIVTATSTCFSALGGLAAFFDANWVFAGPDYDNSSGFYNCEFWGGLIGGGTVNAIDLTCYNCLFDRSSINYWMTAGSSILGWLSLQNCTLHGGNLTFNASPAGMLHLRDCALDHTDLSGVDTSYTGAGSYNAYVLILGNPAGSYLPGSDPNLNPNHDVFVSVSSGFNWRGGPMGEFYLPNDPPAQDGRLLIDANNEPGDPLASDIPGYNDNSTTLASFTTDPVYQTLDGQTPDGSAVNIGYHYVPIVAPQLVMDPCNPFESGTGVGVLLDWSITGVEQQCLYIPHFKIYRSTVSGGPYGNPIASVDGWKRYYWDNTAVNSQTYYYVVTFDYQAAGTIRESPYSNDVVGTAHPSGVLLPSDATWDVTDVTHANHIGPLQAPFGFPLDYATENLRQPPLIPVSRNSQNIYWNDNCDTWECHYSLVIPSDWTPEQLALVEFSFAVDNDITVYINDTLVVPHLRLPTASWSPFQVLPYQLNAGGNGNDIKVVIYGDCDSVDYFSMVITTNDCGVLIP